MNLENMKQKLEELKNQAQSFLDANKVTEAEKLSVDIKILNAQIDIQDKLETANAELDACKNDVVAKDEVIDTLTKDLENIKTSKEDIMAKYNDATETASDLKAKVDQMQPIVDKFYEEENARKLEEAKNTYEEKFEKVNGLEVFDSEEIQNLVVETISEDTEVSNNAKYSLSNKIMEIFDKQDLKTIPVKDVQEKSKSTKNLVVEDDEFEKTYGFTKE